MTFHTRHRGAAHQRHLLLAAGCFAILCLAGCGSSGKEKAPVVNVEVNTRAARSDFGNNFGGGSGVPVTAGDHHPENHFDDQDISRCSAAPACEKGNCWRCWKMPTFPPPPSRAKANSSKPKQATSRLTGASLPEQIQKAELDAAAAKAAFDAQQKVYDSRKDIV